MKIIVQIPCFNEAETLPGVIAEMPRSAAGIDQVEVLVIDDGSTDGTADLALRLGVEHVVRHRRNRGLAAAFQTGIETCLHLGADVIVNTDGDNQYAGEDIPRLIAPILRGGADVVIGDRRPADLPHFSRGKRLLQAFGSAVVRRLSRTDVPDAVSGFRAFSRDAALQLNLVNSFSHTIETVMQIGDRRLAVVSVPIQARRVERRSRLFQNVPQFLRRSATVLIRSHLMYHPLQVLTFIGLSITAVGLVPIVRFVYFFATDGGQGHIQSLVLGSALLCIGFMTLVLGLLADLIASNRRLIELTLEKVRRIELGTETSREPDRAERTHTSANDGNGRAQIAEVRSRL
ncbi:MAG: glycosyltransferase family 2 protein [Planctomycetota bacterium]|nr:glycosyltransferase family 2 protein [Planctomycetaceae bacterium]MDQ3330333.1 glycosyltransferase family 2 protein [Planctomycetota bacterium]